MKCTYENSQPGEVRELYTRLSALEDQFVELFVRGGSRDLLKQLHVQLKVLKFEIQLKENQHA
jgi:hypothetical protein